MIWWIDQKVVIDENLNNSRTKWFLPGFARALINAISRAPSMTGVNAG